MNNEFCVALVGNPNAGKSTLFNALTGDRQHVGNWPGKTVDMKQGRFAVGDTLFTLVDLPGTYSLSPYSAEEKVTRDFLLYERPDVIMVVVDASNLERNLYLVVQVIELGLPAILVLNMSDRAESRGLKIDTAALAARLSIPVVITTATQGKGLEQLKTAVLQAVAAGEQSARQVPPLKPEDD